MTSWGHDPSEIPVTGALTMILDALQHSPILVQPICNSGQSEAKTKMLPFPAGKDDSSKFWQTLPELRLLYDDLDLSHTCGYVTLLDFDVSEGKAKTNSGEVKNEENSSNVHLLAEELDKMNKDEVKNKLTLDLKPSHWLVLDLNFGIPLFDSDLNKRICDSIVSNGLWKKER